MMYNNITQEDINFFKSIIGENNLCIEKDILLEYSHDETEDLSFLPEIVLKPRSSEEVSSILNHCNSTISKLALGIKKFLPSILISATLTIVSDSILCNLAGREVTVPIFPKFGERITLTILPS